jgi:hypothetical protein
MSILFSILVLWWIMVVEVSSYCSSSTTTSFSKSFADDKRSAAFSGITSSSSSSVRRFQRRNTITRRRHPSISCLKNRHTPIITCDTRLFMSIRENESSSLDLWMSSSERRELSTSSSSSSSPLLLPQQDIIFLLGHISFCVILSLVLILWEGLDCTYLKPLSATIRNYPDSSSSSSTTTTSGIIHLMNTSTRGMGRGAIDRMDGWYQATYLTTTSDIVKTSKNRMLLLPCQIPFRCERFHLTMKLCWSIEKQECHFGKRILY